ncbi:MAG: DUF763 domain-containing protein [Thermoplasmata archaeon]|nr:MAG: DUF763 domain-containing protein [Thermoplasmata archaeon]
MKRTGIANLPLHPGRAPRWLFARMVRLSRAIMDVLTIEYGKDEILRRLSDPFWFQALSCVLGFDWHSSGTTTVTCGALKEALNPEEHGIAIAGGKGRVSRKTPDEIENFGEKLALSTSMIENLKYASRMAAKVDNAAIQDGYTLYHHVLIFSEDGKWTIIQQGMNENNHYARRYHWYSENLKSYVNEPHSAIVGDNKERIVLDMTSSESSETRKVCVDIVCDSLRNLKRDWGLLTKGNLQTSLEEWKNPIEKQRIELLDMPRNINWGLMRKIHEFQPKNYEELLSIRGVGPKTVRALALISDLIYGAKPSWKDPIKYTFAVGGKDGVPFPVDRKVMDESIEILRLGIEEAKIGNDEKLKALRRLRNIIPNLEQKF